MKRMRMDRRILKVSSFVFLCTLLVLNVSAQLSQIRFEHLDDRDGLSHNRVTSILQDELGFMWFGTLSGLNRYDGTEIKVLKYDENDPYSLNNSNIIWIKEGPERRIWVKTSYGVFAYDIYKEKFVDISKFLTALGINNYNLRDIIKDRSDSYWFLVNNANLSKYDAKQDTLLQLPSDSRYISSLQFDNEGKIATIYTDGQTELLNPETMQVESRFEYPEYLKDNDGLSALIDRDGAYWYFSSSFHLGACYYQPENGSYKVLGEKELGSNLVTAIIQDQNGSIIIGIDHVGLAILNKHTWDIQQYGHNPTDPKSLNHNTIVSLYGDRSGMIWIGTNKGGINYYSPKSVKFKFFKQTGTEAIENDMIQIVEGDDNDLWVGTDGGGLLHFDLQTNKFKRYNRKAGANSLSSDIIVSMAKGNKGDLWIGTYLGGLNHFDGKKFKSYVHDVNDPNSPCDNSIWKLYMDSRGFLWIGTLKSGVDVYDANFKKVYHFDQNNSDIHSSYITAFQEDPEGRMWIGSGYGVEVFDPVTESFRHYLKEENNPNSLSNNNVVDMFMDNSLNIWVGTMYGLNKISLVTGEIKNYTKNDGLPHNIITSITQDANGSMWFGTYKGLAQMVYEKSEPHFENFDISDGLQGDMFNERSVAKLESGELVFGGKNGINIFDPKQITVEDQVSKLVFLDFFVSNKQIRPDEIYNDRKWFEEGINNTEKLVLKHNENSFSFGFTTLSFYQQENTLFKYRLKGFDTTWVVHPNIRRANYTNLDPGNYRFEVMAADQSDPDNASFIGMDIQILYPFWKTPLAYGIYALLVLIGLYITRNMIIQKERFRAKVYQERVESKQMHELDLMKIKFFTNISHEFRTPLTLIITPIERLMRKMAGSPEEGDFRLIYRNAKRLLTLVNQLLDFRKMEADQHKLSLSSGDLVTFIGDIVSHFSDMSEDRRVQLNFESSIPAFLTFFDSDKMEKILFNLLSNAFKFTPENGTIVVKLWEVTSDNNSVELRITVTDTGIGIPKDKQEDIFKRFFQVDDSKTLNLNHGSGIGLSITKEFTEMHGGKISVESEPGKGSTFMLDLPMKRLEPLERINSINGWNKEAEELSQFSPNKATILIVEDNADFRYYLVDNLKEFFNVVEAQNGKDAWKKLMDRMPDLVVTDIMMPEMNGVELCKKIKADPRSAHVPVILLSARYSDDQKMEGYEAGASEYITKPFNFEILLRSIKASIQLQKMIHVAENRKEVNPTEIEIVSLDQKLIQKALMAVEDNMSNADFSVQELSRHLGVSRGQLYKKTLEITGKTPIEFIRAIRLKRAAALLDKSQLTVAEVAYKVGFNNPKYFTKYFRSEFDILPSKYSVRPQNDSFSDEAVGQP